jgi:hypothetical protein
MSGLDRRAVWSPPPRPEWVARINAEGAGMDLRHLVPLDADSLLRAAREATGLDDFGDDDWREPFHVLLRALEDEAQLTLMGRLMTRTDLLLFLQARLQVEQAYRDHPEIEDEEIVQPLFIVGQGRTGTTFLQGLLAADPENGTLRVWEVMFPCPPPEAATYETDPRVAIADHLVTQWNRVTPEIEAMHEFAGHVPTENIHLHCLSFRSPGWLNLLGQVPSYVGWTMTQDPAIAYRYEKRVLKLLQWRNPRERWILKSPVCLAQMPAILQVYPDAGFIWTHRDPVRAVASVVSLIGTLYWMRTDSPFVGDSLEMFTNADMAAGMMTLPIGWLEDGTVPRDRVHHVSYRDFVADPVASVEGIYRHFGIALTPHRRAVLQEYADAHARSSRPAHRYEFGSEELVAHERAAFKTYQDYFNVPDEP